MSEQNEVLPVVEKMLNGDILNNRPDSEAVMAKIAANINAFISNNTNTFTFSLVGVMRVNSITDIIDGIVRLDSEYEVDSYYMSLEGAGSSGTTSFNIGVYDADNIFVGNLFSTNVQIGFGSNSGIVVGRIVQTGSDILIEDNVGSHTYNVGVLSGVALLNGYKLKAKIDSSGLNADTMRVDLKLRRVQSW